MATSLIPKDIRYRINDLVSKKLYGANDVRQIGNSFYLNPGVQARGGVTDLTKMQTTKPTPASPIPVEVLGNNNLDLSKILGVNVPNLNVNSDIAGLLSLYGQQSKEQENVDQLQLQLTDAMKQLGGQGADLQAELAAKGVPEMYKQVQELNLKAAQLQGSIGQFDAETEKLKADIEGQAIPTGLLAGQTAELQKQRDLTRLGKAAELSSTIALSQAYQGNAQLASELAKNAVDMKYQPILANIGVLEKQLGFASEKATSAEQKRFAVIGELLAYKKDEIAKQQAVEDQISQIAIEAASNGAPTHIVESIKRSADPASAARAASQYLTANVQYQRQKEMEAVQHKNRLSEIAANKASVSDGNAKLLENLLGKKMAAAEQLGFVRVSKEDGGYDFLYKGQPVSVEDYMKGTGMSIVDALEGSRAQQDIVQSLPDKAKATMATLNSAKAVVAQLENATKKAGLKTNPLAAATFGRAANLNAKFFQSNPNAVNLRNLGQQFLSTLARASGEKGTLAEGDIARAKAGIPQLSDTQAVAAQKLENLKKFIADIENLTVSVYGGGKPGGAEQIDLSGLEQFLQ